MGRGTEGRENESDGPRPLSIAEIISELVYNGRTLAEIADLDDYQLNYIFARRRDESGRLIRIDPELPWWVRDSVDGDGMRVVNNPMPYPEMFVKVKRKQGMSEDESKQSWTEYRKTLPKMKGIE